MTLHEQFLNFVPTKCSFIVPYFAPLLSTLHESLRTKRIVVERDTGHRLHATRRYRPSSWTWS